MEPEPVSVFADFLCPTDGCSQKFECRIILGHASNGPYELAKNSLRTARMSNLDYS